LLEALEDYGGTLIIVSHDRYFVERLATKIIEIGHGEGTVYPGTYTEFLWHKEHPGTPATQVVVPRPSARPTPALGKKPHGGGPAVSPPATREDRKRDDAERRKQQRARDTLRQRIAEMEVRIAAREAEVKTLESAMSASGFYDDPDAASTAINRHKALMWEVGDLIAQWEALQEHATES